MSYEIEVRWNDHKHTMFLLDPLNMAATYPKLSQNTHYVLIGISTLSLTNVYMESSNLPSFYVVIDITIE